MKLLSVTTKTPVVFSIGNSARPRNFIKLSDVSDIRVSDDLNFIDVISNDKPYTIPMGNVSFFVVEPDAKPPKPVVVERKAKK